MLSMPWISTLEAAPGGVWLGDVIDIRQHGLPAKLSCYMLLYAARSGLTVVIDGTPVELAGHHIVFIKPGTIINLYAKGEMNGKCLCFTGTFLSSGYNVAWEDFAISRQQYIDVDLSDALQGWECILTGMDQEYRDQQLRVNDVLRSYVNILLCKLDRKLSNIPAANRRLVPDDKIRQFRLLLEKHFFMHRTAAFYAAQLNISANYLNKLCKMHESISCGAMIRRRIIMEAQRLLYYTKLPVVEIANRLGFESSSYFITFFKRNVGLTPDNFRKDRQ
jgi:AraC-like DNA-binding protein